MTKPQRKQELKIEIGQLEDRIKELTEYLKSNIDADNFEEIASDKRALEIKLNNRNRELKEFDSKRFENIAECNVFIPLGFRYARR